MTIIVINGSGGVGKDTFCQLFNEVCENDECTSMSTIDAVKEVAKQFGWKGEKNDKAREFLSSLKDAWTNYCDGPFKDIIQKIDNYMFYGWDYIFVHCREPQEIQKFVDYYDGTEVKVVTLLMSRSSSEKFSNHADSEVENFDYNYYIDNSGTVSDLKNEAKKFQIYLQSLPL